MSAKGTARLEAVTVWAEDYFGDATEFPAGLAMALWGVVSELWYDDRRNLAMVARYMGERGDSVDDVAYMLERPHKFEDDWQQCADGQVVGRCRTCEDNGYHCYPTSDLPLIACPGEVCATCDYRAGEQEVTPL